MGAIGELHVLYTGKVVAVPEFESGLVQKHSSSARKDGWAPESRGASSNVELWELVPGSGAEWEGQIPWLWLSPHAQV